MMNIVVMLPPAHGHAAENVGNRDADQRVNAVVVRDRQVTSIVRREGQLMPERAEKDGRQSVMPRTCCTNEEVARQKAQNGIS